MTSRAAWKPLGDTRHRHCGGPIECLVSGGSMRRCRCARCHAQSVSCHLDGVSVLFFGGPSEAVMGSIDEVLGSAKVGSRLRTDASVKLGSSYHLCADGELAADVFVRRTDTNALGIFCGRCRAQSARVRRVSVRLASLGDEVHPFEPTRRSASRLLREVTKDPLMLHSFLFFQAPLPDVPEGASVRERLDALQREWGVRPECRDTDLMVRVTESIWKPREMVEALRTFSPTLAADAIHTMNTAAALKRDPVVQDLLAEFVARDDVQSGPSGGFEPTEDNVRLLLFRLLPSDADLRSFILNQIEEGVYRSMPRDVPRAKITDWLLKSLTPADVYRAAQEYLPQSTARVAEEIARKASSDAQRARIERDASRFRA